MQKMSYNDLFYSAELEKEISLNDVKDVLEMIISGNDEDFDFEYDLKKEYTQTPKYRLKQIALLIDNEEIKIDGSADDFHNVAVDFARENEYTSACLVLERGLKKVPNSVDLIADLMRYRLSNGGYEECEKLYCHLQTIERRTWNWRAFTFSIDYLVEKFNLVESEEERMKIRTEAFNLANDFIARIPCDTAYFNKAVVVGKLGSENEENEQSVLREGIKKLRVSPKCSLRLADILFDKGRYKETIRALSKCFINKFVPQPDINADYAFLLIAYSKLSALFENGQKNSYVDDTELINEIYKDIHTALTGLSGVYERTARSTINVIQAQTGIEYPYYDDSYYDDSSYDKYNF